MLGQVGCLLTCWDRDPKNDTLFSDSSPTEPKPPISTPQPNPTRDKPPLPLLVLQEVRGREDNGAGLGPYPILIDWLHKHLIASARLQLLQDGGVLHVVLYIPGASRAPRKVK